MKRGIACFLFSFIFAPSVHADTILLKNGKELKGLVVEHHEDRILVSTEKGEIPILRRGIKSIAYDAPEQNFMQAGKAYEAKERWGEALGYYEKALEANPDYEEARQAAVRVRNLFWAMSAVGPVNEVAKKQLLYDSWGKGKDSKNNGKTTAVPHEEQNKLLRENLGLSLEKKGDWMRVSSALPKKDAALAGMKAGDRLVAIDGSSLRYLNPEAVKEKFLSPRYSQFTLEIERDLRISRIGNERSPEQLGLKLELEYRGLVAGSVAPASSAEKGGIKAGDLIVAINGASTRYLPLKKVMSAVHAGKEPQALFSVRRPVLLTRK